MTPPEDVPRRPRPARPSAVGLLGARPPTWYQLRSSIEQLADIFPRACRLTPVGSSRGGESLELLTVRGGDLHLLVVGGPHPNEPVGLATVLALARHAVSGAGPPYVTWHFLPCADPDGARLNEPWTAAAPWPPTLRTYHRGFYRPARDDQPEWAFPGAGHTGRLPETEAMMEVIDTVRPHGFVSLHNSDTGDAFYVTNRAEPRLPGVLRTAARRHGLSVGRRPSDAIGWNSPGPGVFVLPTTGRTRSRRGREVRRGHGAGSADYAGRHGALGLSPVTPLWQSSGARLPAHAGAEILRSAGRTLGELWERARTAVNGESAFAPAVEDTLAIMALVARALGEHPDQGGGQDSALLLPLRTAGMLLRHLDVVTLSWPYHPELPALRLRAEETFETWCRAAETAIRPVALPLRRTAGFQVDTVLALAELLAG
ncbi:M14 family zinc carboxypeptidase [Streptomyces tsukubensis]|uniref:M14 family zinc carboxypeptidase n=1 Tax=Streptomyces tsukubensis TaxID=83656 RepID=UPI001D03B669|nr:M14 family zinc carboxypeptidase [Streptomyces tsukubensis]